MPNFDQTICAISTPAGVGGIAVARVSGHDAVAIVNKIWGGKPLADLSPRKVHLGPVIDSNGELLDNALVTIFKAPASYTGEDVVEIAVHGSRWIQQELISSLCAAGARLAEPGEFTRRAVASGRIDLAEAEGVADIIASRSRGAHRLAVSQIRGDLSRRLTELRDSMLQLASLLELELDFSEEDVEFASRQNLRLLATETLAEVNRLEHSFTSGSAIRDGIPVAIVGATNAGKSSLLNTLVHDDRAIVSDIHGTTRDIIEDTVNFGDYTFRLLDTAGLRHTTDTIEALGIERSRNAIEKALIVILVIDATDAINWEIVTTAATPLHRDDGSMLIIAINKTDIAPDNNIGAELKAHFDRFEATPQIIEISAKTGDGIDALQQKIIGFANDMAGQADLIITNARHQQALKNAAQSLEAVIDSLDQNLSADFIAQDVRETIHHLSSITGAITTPDILATIFSRFCIGK